MEQQEQPAAETPAAEAQPPTRPAPSATLSSPRRRASQDIVNRFLVKSGLDESSPQALKRNRSFYREVGTKLRASFQVEKKKGRHFSLKTVATAITDETASRKRRRPVYMKQASLVQVEELIVLRVPSNS